MDISLRDSTTSHSTFSGSNVSSLTENNFIAAAEVHAIVSLFFL
ncbi:hypothetical protein AAZX31_11G108400 [Glycine max]